MTNTDEIKTKEAVKTSSVTPIELTGTTTVEKVKEITEKLEQGIKDLFDSEKFKEYLTTMSKFHNYSFRNTMLILFQKPDASFIAGYGAWQKNFNRQVKKGEKGIKILAPAPYKKTIEETRFDKSGAPMKDKDGNVITTSREVTVPAFKVTTVFDLSQTAGDELPQLAKQLTGDIEEYERFFRALKDISPVPIELETFDRAANGYYHLEEKRIAIRNDLSEMQTIKTAIHEIAHAKLHALPENDTKDLPEEKRPDNRTREVQAESVAYTVCQHFGIDTSDYSFGYIAGWSSGKETEELKNSLETIRTAATELITDIENRVNELIKEQEKPVFDLESDVAVWYASEFPSDDLKENLVKGVSFQKMFDMVGTTEFKNIIGEDDSVVRQRCFEKISELMGIDYNVIYDKWLNIDKKQEKQTTKKPSIKKQLEKNKEKKADEPKPKKTTKKKTQDLEV